MVLYMILQFSYSNCVNCSCWTLKVSTLLPSWRVCFSYRFMDSWGSRIRILRVRFYLDERQLLSWICVVKLLIHSGSCESSPRYINGRVVMFLFWLVNLLTYLLFSHSRHLIASHSTLVITLPLLVQKCV